MERFEGFGGYRIAKNSVGEGLDAKVVPSLGENAAGQRTPHEYVMLTSGTSTRLFCQR